MAGGGIAQAVKRIPRIKFPQRHPKPSAFEQRDWGVVFWDSTSQLLGAKGSGSQSQEASGNADLPFFSGSNVSKSVGGRASDQPKRTPVSNEEIESIMLGGCI